MPNESTIPTPATPDVCTATLLIDGAEVSGQFHVLSVNIARELNRIPSALIQLRDGEASVGRFEASNTPHFIPGKKIKINLGYRSQEETVFEGIIIKHSVKVRKSGSSLLIECRDEAVKMTRGLHSHYFTDQKDSDILEELIGKYGLSKDVSATTTTHKEVVQYNSTDWDFMLCRAEANGHVVRVENGKILIGPPDVGQAVALKLQFGSTILEMDAEIDARDQSKGIKASSWNAADQELIEVEAQEPRPLNAGNLSPSSLADVIGGEAHTLRHGGKLSQPELQAWANGTLLKERLSKVRGRAKCQGTAALLPGKVVEIERVGDRIDGKVYVSGVRHTLAGGNWETDVQFGLSTERFAETYHLRPLPAEGLLPAVSGLQVGIVTALEGDPDGEDRIKVRLPLVSMAEEGTWARLATLDAGKERGTFFRPEIGDEVIVGFLHDDPRHPVVLGMLHSSNKPAPEPPKDDNHQKGYVSREKMKLTFDDEKKIVQLETPSGNRFALTEEDKGIQLEDQNGNKLTLNDEGITIESFKDVIIKAVRDVKVEGVNVTLKGQASLTAEASGNTVIKGSMVQIN